MPGLNCKLARALMHLYPFPRGQGRIVDRTFLSHLRFEEETLQVRTRDGFVLRVFPNDLIGRHIYLTGQFDRTIAEVLIAHSREGDRVLDVGANIGYISCVLLNCIPGARVASVEPQPPCFKLLSENITTVGKGRGVAFQAAMSSTAGRAKMTLVPGNTGGGFIDTSSQGAGAQQIEVELVTGQQVVERAGFERVDLIKIDVEGHEVAVLESLMPVLKRHRPRAVAFECYHPEDVLSADGKVRQLFQEADYEVFGIKKSLTRWELPPISQLDRGHVMDDFVARPSGASAKA